MNKEQEDFISQNHKKLSSRQMAKRLGCTRSEVEKFLSRSCQPHSPERSVPSNLSGSRESLILSALFLAALVLRAVYILWLSKTPFFEPLSPKLDDGVYDLMGQEMSRGNWIGNLPFAAYRIPLYPYFLAVLYHFFGRNLLAVHLVQSFVGALSPLFVYGIAKRVFEDSRVAVTSGVLTCFYIPFIFFDNLLLGESLSIFFNLWALWILANAVSREKIRVLRLATAGFLFGLSVLLRPNTLVPVAFLALFFAWFFGLRRKEPMRGFIFSLLFLVAAVMPLVPVAVKNHYLYKDVLPISAVGGVNFYVGNNPEADGKFHLIRGIGTGLDEMVKNSHELAEKAAGRSLKPSEASSYWMRKGFDFILSSPAAAIGLYAKKTAYFLNRYEFPDILDIQFTAQFIPFLIPGVFMYGIVLVLACCGLFCCHRDRAASPPAVLIEVFIAGYFLSVVLFFVTARYRLPVVPFLIVFASYAVCRWVRTGRKTGVFGCSLVALAAGLLAFWPVEQASFGTNYNSLAIAMKNKGYFKEAEKYYKKAMELEPRYPSPYYNLALLYDESGRSWEAAEFYQKFEALKQRER